MNLTQKQLLIMKVIAEGNTDGSVCDLDEILDRLDYDTTKASIQFSIRSLIKHNLIEKRGTETRRGRKRVLIAATEAGMKLVKAQPAGPSNTASFIESPEETFLESLV